MPMGYTLAGLAALVHGHVHGDSALAIHGAAPLGLAQPGEIAFLEQVERIKLLQASAASAFVVPLDCVPPDGRPALQVADVFRAFQTIYLHFHPRKTRPRIGISPAAHISPTAVLGAEVEIHPGATIGDEVTLGARCTIHAGARIGAGCRLADDVTIHANAVLYDNTLVGPRSIIHGGAVVGADGFGYRTQRGRHERVEQLGHVEIGADVEVGALSTIDRGTYGPTLIGDGTKIDNLVMIAHNCRIGKHNLVCAQVGIAGSSATGDYVVLAGQVGIRDHVRIGDKVIVGAQAGVPHDIPEAGSYLGTPVTDEWRQKQIYATIHKLPELRKELRTLQKALAEMQERLRQQGNAAA